MQLRQELHFKTHRLIYRKNMLSENKQKTDFISVFATGIISQEKKDYSQEALTFAKISPDTLSKWLTTDQLFNQIYSELQNIQPGTLNLQSYMIYVQGLRSKLLNRQDIIDVQFTSEIT